MANYERPFDQMQREEARRAAEWAALTPMQIRRRIHDLDDHPMRETFGRILAGAIQRHAPQHVGLLPPEWLTQDTP